MPSKEKEPEESVQGHLANCWQECSKLANCSSLSPFNTQWSPTLCNLRGSNPPGSSVHGILRQECWSGLPFPTPRDLPHPGTKLRSPMSPALAGGFFTTSATWEAPRQLYPNKKKEVICSQHFLGGNSHRVEHWGAESKADGCTFPLNLQVRCQVSLPPAV